MEARFSKSTLERVNLTTWLQKWQGNSVSVSTAAVQMTHFTRSVPNPASIKWILTHFITARKSGVTWKFGFFAFLNVSRILILSSFCFSPLFASFNITYLLYEDNNISDIFLCLGNFISFAHIWQELEGVFLYTTEPTGWPKYVNIQAFLRKIKVYGQRNKMTVFS